jgi:hypothetical protein
MKVIQNFKKPHFSSFKADVMGCLIDKKPIKVWKKCSRVNTFHAAREHFLTLS